ncbi:dTDP-4-amino-4,6-dideoxygalactose transaminase [Paraconexibacter antarcticus]|uniref:dTDP-4-amino-4,6-dideoxygalactose transaminase n=1 Tax=Paraconexibacter antarcticus TaxID=2949664 RepID=A0ABY5DQH0_9ACTN|nr:dTDP-4-amino-4,6-dideoxygalactose transaminase [Paraconexibacter antarcticus]UTI63478.1 dTDP-4-amino-4,6-dideoxygalactose transaminase [Paraconexibacter antarcticus]
MSSTSTPTSSARPSCPRPVPFQRTTASVSGAAAVAAAIAAGELKARGPATRRCEELLARALGAGAVLMVQSCTAALELAMRLLDLGPGDEVVMPSFGFASSANAVVLRGGVPVFVDIDPATGNVDPDAVEAAVTTRTRAIVPVHYAGVGADMDRLRAIAKPRGIALVEDAAQGIGATYRGRALGSIGSLGALSFDATKNLTSGSGGALVVNDRALVARAEALRDYGTDRARFTRGEVTRYRWIDAGSNFALNELAAAYLAPQLEELDAITAARRLVWDRFHAALGPAEWAGHLTRPVVPGECRSNAHIYAVTLPTHAAREQLRRDLGALGVEATFHYVPLHSSPAGLRHARVHGDLAGTESFAARLLRLPLHTYMAPHDADRVIEALLEVLPTAVAA